MVAEVTHDLENRLLLSGGSEKTRRHAPKKPRPGQFQNRIILPSRPTEIARLGRLRELLVFSGKRSKIKPGQEHVHDDVGDSLLAEQRLRFFERLPSQSPSITPERSLIYLEDQLH